MIWVGHRPGASPGRSSSVLATGVNLLQTLFHRDDIVEEHVRKLEKRERRALERARRPRADQGERDEDTA